MNTKARIAKFKELMHPYIGEETTSWLMREGFFTAPASSHHHGAYEGGLFDHSLAVTEALVDLTVKNDLDWWRGDSPYLVGMFHDLCKIDQYEEKTLGGIPGGAPVPGEWQYHAETKLKGHGDKSILLLSTLMQLTEEEVMCIRYHMGAFTDKDEWGFYSRAVHEFPNVLWTHTADMIASQIKQI